MYSRRRKHDNRHLKKGEKPRDEKNDPSNLPDSAEAWVSHTRDDLDADIGRWHGLLVVLVRLLVAFVDDHLVVLAAKHLLRS